ncbi:MAG: ROK family protein [Cetobacterium sp.]|uniref:ROK family protein n=1 Tax=Cetobacterium sp. TaxID=2071632 RepID=UPI003F2B2814
MYQKKIKESNEKKVFHYIYQKKDKFSIADISNDLNISFPTVKIIIDRFLKENIIKENLKIGLGVGRKAQYYSLENNFIYGIGISISSKELKIVLGNERGELIKEVIIKENFFLANLIEKIDEILEEFLSSIDSKVKNKISGIGISIPGIVNEENNIIELTPKLHLSLLDLKNISIKYNKKILIDNEANLCALSEKFLGIAKDFSNFIVINISENLNMSKFLEEEEFGKFSFTAARVNHMNIKFDGLLCECGNRGCWGKYASESSLIQRFNDNLFKINKLSDIFDLDNMKSNSRQNILENYVNYLAIGIKNIIFLYNPEKIIISGNLSNYKKYFSELLINNIYEKNIFFKGEDTIEFSLFKGKGVSLGAVMLPIIDKLF